MGDGLRRDDAYAAAVHRAVARDGAVANACVRRTDEQRTAAAVGGEFPADLFDDQHILRILFYQKAVTIVVMHDGIRDRDLAVGQDHACCKFGRVAGELAAVDMINSLVMPQIDRAVIA